MMNRSNARDPLLWKLVLQISCLGQRSTSSVLEPRTRVISAPLILPLTAQPAVGWCGAVYHRLPPDQCRVMSSSEADQHHPLLPREFLLLRHQCLNINLSLSLG